MATVVRRRKLRELAATQGGYFSAAQATKVGYSAQAQQYNYKADNWQRLARGIYRLRGWPMDDYSHYGMWWLWAGEESVISHQTALEIHGLGEFAPRVVHLSVSKPFNRTNKQVKLYTKLPPRHSTQAYSWFKVTSPLQSIIDVAIDNPGHSQQLHTAIDDALDRKLFSIQQLKEEAIAQNMEAASVIESAIERLTPLAV